jgi:malonyl-CoA O-methyltransferase
MNIIREFSRFANLYEKHNIIQSQVANKLVSNMIENRYYDSIIDIGCGSGAIYKNIIKRDIKFGKFIGADLSEEMLRLHPDSNRVTKISFDFNSKDSFKKLKDNYSIVISSSALQWSNNLDFTLKEVSTLSNQFYFAIFTSNTFKTLHSIANIKSPIYQKEYIQKIIDKYYISTYETINYKLNFNSVYEMLRYIKQSGVSGGKKQLSYKETKNIIDKYPLNYLEFEVLFIKAKKRLKN